MAKRFDTVDCNTTGTEAEMVRILISQIMTIDPKGSQTSKMEFVDFTTLTVQLIYCHHINRDCVL